MRRLRSFLGSLNWYTERHDRHLVADLIDYMNILMIVLYLSNVKPIYFIDYYVPITKAIKEMNYLLK